MMGSTPWYRRWAPGKKVVAALVGVGVQLLPYFSPETKEEIGKLVIGFIVGQGIADAGKEKALIERSAPPPAVR